MFQRAEMSLHSRATAGLTLELDELFQGQATELGRHWNRASQLEKNRNSSQRCLMVSELEDNRVAWLNFHGFAHCDRNSHLALTCDLRLKLYTQILLIAPVITYYHQDYPYARRSD